MALSKHCQLAWAGILGQSTALSPFVFDNGPIWSLQITLQFAVGCSLLGIYGTRYEFESLPAIRQFMYSQRRIDICARNAIWDTVQAVIDVSYSVCLAVGTFPSTRCETQTNRIMPASEMGPAGLSFSSAFCQNEFLILGEMATFQPKWFLRPTKVQWWRFSSQIKSLSKSVLPKVDSHPVLCGERIILSNTAQFHLQHLRLYSLLLSMLRKFQPWPDCASHIYI